MESLIWGIFQGSVILFLATSGADVNARDKYGLTPLHYSAMRGNDDAANDLLQLPETNLEVKKKIKTDHDRKYYIWRHFSGARRTKTDAIALGLHLRLDECRQDFT